ncbi:MAG: HAMP domain-containing histidine kinase [Bacteroidales bacterium]|nr:HAMP domain-containing histidine kinase [Bacteroidales bacterium]
MVYNSFRIKIVVRVLFIGILIFFLVYALHRDKWYFTSAGLLLAVVGLLTEMIRFIEKYFRNFNKLLFSLKHRDFTSSFHLDQKEKIPKEQKNAFNEIISEFRDVRIEKEAHYEYLKTLVEHVKTGIICFEESGKVNLINTSAKNILKTPLLNNLTSVKKTDNDLYDAFTEIQTGEKRIIKIKAGEEFIQLLIWCKEFKLQDNNYKLVSFQNIKNELDVQEFESWQKLIRIMNHEIMNTVTPISSLSSEVNEMLYDISGKKIELFEINKDDLDDIYSSMKTIEKRSKGLLKFVKTYKNISRLPRPHFVEVKINNLLNNLKTLLYPELKKNKINFEISVSNKDLRINADPEMIEQVLINLVLNAKYALLETKEPQIEISAHYEDENVYIRIKDNGSGIEQEYIDQIFIPFFTTKKNGSGIGLSLSKQIMLMHKGNISVQSNEGKGTIFTLRFISKE